MPLVQELQDDFNDNIIDSVKWPAPEGSIAEVGGQARVTCATGNNAYGSASIFTLDDSYAYVRMIPPPAGGATIDAYAQLQILSSVAGTDAIIRSNSVNGQIMFANRTGFVDATQVNLTYDAVMHAWVRIREESGTLLFDTSPDGFIWTNQYGTPSPAWTSATNLKIRLLSTRNNGVNTFAFFDNFNTNSAYSLRVDWQSDGSFSGTDDDVTENVLDGGRWSFGYGRDQNRQLSPSSIGQAAFTVCNADRLYSPENEDSPLVNDLGPARDVAFDTVINGTQYPLFRGKIDDFDVHPDRSNRTVDFTALDGLADLANFNLSTALYAGLRTGEIVDIILDEAGWTAARSIDPGASFTRFWWEEGTDALTAMASIVRAEGPPAIAYVGPDGTFRFEDRHHRLQSPASLDSQATFAAGRVGVCPPPTGSLPVTGFSYTEPFGYQHGWRDVVNTFSQDVPERLMDGVLSVVWSTDSPFSLLTGQTVEIRVQANDPFSDAVTPVPVTDFTTIGTGVVSATLDRTSGQSATIRFTSVGGPATVTFAQLRALSVPVSRTITVMSDDAGSVSLHGTKAYPDTIEFATAEDVFAVAQAILSNYADRRPTVQIRVVSCDTEHLEQIVTRAISDQITIRNDEMGLNSGFTIESISQVITRIPNEADCDDRVPVHSAVFGCEMMQDECGGNPFTFDKVGAGFDDGTFDPIGCSEPGVVWIWDTQSQFDVNTFAV